MSQSLVQIYLHIVFSTKHRQSFLANVQLREKLHAYMAGICDHLASPAIIIGGVADHVHLLIRFSKTLSVADFIRKLKRASSIWVKETDPQMASFHWQRGYGAFSLSPSHLDELKHYIANQEKHHRTESFQDEFRRLCRKYGVEIDERYVWD